MAGGEGPSYDKNDAHLARLHEKLAEGKRLQSYVLSALSNVPPKVFPYYVEFIHAIRMLLQYRYNIQVTSSLLDNENSLDGLTHKEKAQAVYNNDQASVVWGDINIGEGSIIAHGFGEEAERCRVAGIPLVVLAAGKGKSKSLAYYIESADGGFKQKEVHIGGGGVSLMVWGNPAVKDVSVYPRDSLKTKLFQLLENAAWKMEYNAIGLKWASKAVQKAGSLIHRATEGKNPKTIALRMLDSSLQKTIGLTPETEKLKAQLKTAEAAETAEIWRKIELLDSLLAYHPLKTHHDYKSYKEAFPEQAKRVSPKDIREGRNTALFERTLSTKFLPKHVKRQLRAVR